MELENGMNSVQTVAKFGQLKYIISCTWRCMIHVECILDMDVPPYPQRDICIYMYF